MESDEDYQSLSAPQEPSPPPRHRRLKRLKKANAVSCDLVAELGSEIIPRPLPPVDLSESKALEPCDGFDVGTTADQLQKWEESKETERVLDFDGLSEELDGKEFEQNVDMEKNFGDLENIEKSEKRRRHGDDGSNENKAKERKRAWSGGDAEKTKSSASNKRREEKERKIYLQQLHIESQKLLRETRDASFKPTPLVQKPISLVLDKIRQRKLEVMKKSVDENSNFPFVETNGPLEEVFTGNVSDKDSTKQREVGMLSKVLQEQTALFESNSDDFLANRSNEAATQSNSPSKMALDEQSTHAFRAPVDDTQDLFSDSQASEEKGGMSNDQTSCPLEEVFAPSLLAMNLKFDSAPLNDISSDEEYNDKENVEPDPDRADNGCSSPTGDPVKAFVDEEAVEEDDSDNDMRLEEHEEESYEDDEELKDMIATEYEENAIDNDMRNELHQEWLEQQDATGTDNLLQRLKYGSKLKKTTFFEDEQEEDVADDKEFCDEVAEDPVKASVTRINTRKARQMIPRMFSDNDGYLSSDEEEAEKRLTKQRLLDKVEEQSTLVPPAEDENSREIFGRIKKLNIMPDTKKKAKALSTFDKMPTGGKACGPSKPSFVGRKGNHFVPSSHKQGTSTARSFIFGRDDSNSRSSLSMSEDSSGVIVQDTRPTKSVTTKFSSSQFKVSTQITNTSAGTADGGSLFELLKRSSMQSSVGNGDCTVGLTQTVFAAFKIPKKPSRVQGRT